MVVLTSLVVLFGATAVVAGEAYLVSGTLEATAGNLGLSCFSWASSYYRWWEMPQNFRSVLFARQDRMGLVISIAVGSSIQVALLMAPLLVLISYGLRRPMNLVFSNPLELIAITATALAVDSIAQDGETTWFEGVLLIAVYALLGHDLLFCDRMRRNQLLRRCLHGRPIDGASVGDRQLARFD